MTKSEGQSAEYAGEQAAREFRDAHGLGVQPLGDLAAIIEQSTGWDVAVLDVARDQHGLTMRDPARGVTFIGVARTRHPMRQRSTFAHELAHVIFGDWDSREELSDRSPAEVRADAFARHLLVPVEGLRTHLGQRETFTEADLSAVMQRFLVSPQIAAINLARAGYISAATKMEWLSFTTPTLAARYGWSEQYQSLQDGSDRPRPPRKLLARAIAGYSEGVVSAQTIATLRGIGAEQVEAELAAAGIAPGGGEDAAIAPAKLPEVSIDLSDLDSGECRDGTE